MKNFRLLKYSILAILIAISLVLLPGLPASAQARLYVSPDSSKVGRIISVYGSGFTAGQLVYLYFSSDYARINDRIDEDVTAYEVVTTTSAGTTGTSLGIIDTDFTVPARLTDGETRVNVRNGPYYIYATYSSSKIIKAAVDFDVVGTSEITVSPKDVFAGSDLKITGTNFGNQETFTVKYDANTVTIKSGDTITSKTGSFQCVITVPNSVAGVHTVTVTGDKTKLQAKADLYMQSDIILSPQAGAAGDIISVTGTGFGDRLPLNVFFGNFRVVTGRVTDKNGNFLITFEAIAAGAGKQVVEVVDGAGNSGKETFTISATTVSLNPASGYPDTEVTVSGVGFTSSKMVTIRFANTQVRTTATDTSGKFNDKFIVPRLAGGNYEVTVTDGANTVKAPFTITASISLSQTTGHIGSDLTVTGNGFSGVVTIKYDDIAIANTTTDARGMFAVTFKVPVSAHGKHNVTATGAINIIRTDFYVESVSPPVPAPLLPSAASRESSLTTFQWGTVNDPSGVTYQLQIASDVNFTNILLDRKDLTIPLYTLKQTEKLPAMGREAPYYWRVKAIDGALNEGEWSEPGTFYISVFPEWVKYLLIVIGALVAATAIFWAGMKTAQMRAKED